MSWWENKKNHLDGLWWAGSLHDYLSFGSYIGPPLNSLHAVCWDDFGLCLAFMGQSLHGSPVKGSTLRSLDSAIELPWVCTCSLSIAGVRWRSSFQRGRLPAQRGRSAGAVARHGTGRGSLHAAEKRPGMGRLELGGVKACSLALSSRSKQRFVGVWRRALARRRAARRCTAKHEVRCAG
jgi:hypothetical protein